MQFFPRMNMNNKIQHRSLAHKRVLLALAVVACTAPLSMGQATCPNKEWVGTDSHEALNRAPQGPAVNGYITYYTIGSYYGGYDCVTKTGWQCFNRAYEIHGSWSTEYYLPPHDQQGSGELIRNANFRTDASHKCPES